MKRILVICAMICLFGLAISLLNATEVSIGAGDQQARIPVDMYWKNSLFECLYFQDELGFVSGAISEVKFYNNFVTDLPNMPTRIWLGTTNQTSLTAGGWIPSGQLTQVFDGVVNYPAGANTISITFSTPFLYPGGTLVMMVNRPMDTQYYSSNDRFLAQTVGSNRALSISSDTTNFDPSAPPVAGTPSGQFPKTTFVFSGQQISNDLAALSMDGNHTPSVQVQSTYTVTIRNNGAAPQANYTVKLMREGDIEISSVAGTLIQPQANATFSLPWTPAMAGPTYLYAKVECPGDEIPQNNQSGHFEVFVQNAGIVVIPIGDGEATARMPMDFYYKNSLFETVFLASEINTTGLLTGVRFYNQLVYNLPEMPTKIWIGETTASDLASGWIPSTQLTQVFDGTVNYPTGINNIVIPFQTPYAYSGGNLVMMVKRPWDVVYYNSTCTFQAQSGSIPARTRNVYSDSIDFDPAAPPANTPEAMFPRTTLFFTTQGTGNMQGTVTSAGAPVAGASVSIIGTSFSTLTAANGNYSFPYVNAGTYSAQATKHGYNLVEHSVSIVEAQTSTQDFALTPLTQVTVSGRIVDFYSYPTGLSGATITLSGYETYTAVTDANGMFNLPNVYANHTYQCLVQYAGYYDETDEVVVNGTNVDMGNIVMRWIALPPRNVEAVEADNNNYVVIDWDAPAGNPDMVAYKVWRFLVADQNNEANWTMLTPNVIIDPILYDNSWYLLPQGVYKYAVKAYYINSAVSEPAFSNALYKCLGRLHGTVYDYSHALQGATISIIYPDSVYYTSTDENGYYYIVLPEGWCEVMASKPGYNSVTYHVNIEAGEYETVNFVLNEVTPPPYDVHAESVNNNVEITWMAPLPPIRDNDRVLLGYKVWRVPQGYESMPDDWVLLTPNPINSLSYMDTSFSSLYYGAYRWCVKAVYSNNLLSPSAWSNIITLPTQIGRISGIVRNWEYEAIQGVTVSCGDFSDVTDAYGAYSFYALPGTYTVTATHPEYIPQTHSGVVVISWQITNCHFMMVENDIALNDGFESYPDFALNFAPWTCVDADHASTYGYTGYSWPNNGGVMAYQIFNPSATVPPNIPIPPHSGSKLAVCFASIGQFNNDWLISPQIQDAGQISFWARSLSAQYGLERFKVGVSTTGTAPGNFTIISGANYLQAPTTWTLYTYDLSAYPGSIYVGIQCVSNDALLFMVDDVMIQSANVLITQSLPLNAGWNLVSLNVSPAITHIEDLSGEITVNLQQIRGAEGIYMPGNPYSSLTQLMDGRAYAVQMNAADTWDVMGLSIPENTPLPLADGWNPTAYLPRSAMDTESALASINPWIVQVKAPDGVYIPGNPYSTLASMHPGKGYWIKLNGPHHLIYPVTNENTLAAKHHETSAAKHSRTPAALYSSMTVLARCNEAAAGDLLQARVGGELRGQEMLIAPEGFAAVLMQIYTENSGEEISFTLLKPDGRELAISTSISSEPDAILGAYPNFIALELQSTAADEELAMPTRLLGSYPNPFAHETSIRYHVDKDNTPVQLEVYNLKGQMLRCLTDEAKAKGMYNISWDGTDSHGSKVASGLYFIKMRSGAYHKTLKLVYNK